MEEILNSGHGVPAILASIVILLAFQLFLKLGEIAWEMLKKKDEVSQKSITKLTEALETNTKATQELKMQFAEMKDEISTLPQLRLDVRRAFRALRMLAGDEWEEIKKAIMDDTF